MITRVLTVAGWLIAGHALLGALYWVFLQIPESNAWMLASSLLVLLAAMWLAGLIQMTAILAFAVDGPMRGALAAAVRRAWLVVLPVAVVAAAWGLTDAAASWHARYAGQIDAAIIARTGWTRTGWLHETAAWVLAPDFWSAMLDCSAIGVATSRMTTSTSDTSMSGVMLTS